MLMVSRRPSIALTSLKKAAKHRSSPAASRRQEIFLGRCRSPRTAIARDGVAEGIETALAATALYGISVWSIIAEVLRIVGAARGRRKCRDFRRQRSQCCRPTRGGGFARRLGRERGDLKVVVMISDRTGDDWNDVLLRRREVEHARAA